MTITTFWTCDYCGRDIHGPYYATIRVRGRGVDIDTGEDVDLEDDHHYHAGHNGSCYRKAYDALLLAEDFGATLETIPTATGQSIAAKRRKYRKEDEPDGRGH